MKNYHRYQRHLANLAATPQATIERPKPLGQRIADNAAMYNARRTTPRPPRIERSTPMRPLSCGHGAKPAKDTKPLPSPWPNSGNSASNTAAVTAPTPLYALIQGRTRAQRIVTLHDLPARRVQTRNLFV